MSILRVILCGALVCGLPLLARGGVDSAHLGKDLWSEDLQEPKRFAAGSVDVFLHSGAVFGLNNVNDYIILPQVLSMKWRPGPIHGRPWLRRSAAWTFSFVGAPIVQGPESRYFAFALGRRYDFPIDQKRWGLFLEGRFGAGWIDSTVEHVPGAQGQDFTFMVNVEGGLAFYLSERSTLGLGLMYWHMSNAKLSEPERPNTGLDALGPMISFGYTF